MNREGKVHAILFFCATILALLTAKGVLTSSSSGVKEKEIVLVAGNHLQSVHYAFSGAEVDFAVQSKNEMRSANVTYTKEIRVQPAKKLPLSDEGMVDGGAFLPDGGVADIEIKTEVQTKYFPSSKTVNRSLRKLLPLRAVRSLGAPSDDMLKQMGLKNAKQSLKMSVDGKNFYFDVGNAAFGNRHRYLQEKGSNEVFLVDNGVIRGLGGAHLRLMERRIFQFEWKKVTSLTVELKELPKREFFLRDAEQSKKRHFVDAKTDLSVDEALSLAAIIQRISARTYVAKAEAQGEVIGRFLIKTDENKYAGELIQQGENRFFLHSKEWFLQLNEAQGRDLAVELKELMESGH